MRIEISKRESVKLKPEVLEFDALYTDILPFFMFVNEKLKYYKKVFEKEVFMERIKRTEGYWEPELKPLVIGRLPRFELVYNDVKAVLNDLI